jgi:hypothetical protein
MNNKEIISINEYLTKKNIQFRERNGELITNCIFNGCDNDSKGKEAHLYFNRITSQYDCKKCGSKGNIFTLAKYLGDSTQDISLNQSGKNSKKKPKKITRTIVEQYHSDLPHNIKEYLNDRGITDELVDKYKLGWGHFYGSYWITIPVKDTNGEYLYFKLRRNPTSDEKPRFLYHPEGAASTLFGLENLRNNNYYIVICEGELDCILLNSHGIPAITSTAGVGTFKEEWIEYLKDVKSIYICFDRDKAGIKGTEKLVLKLQTSLCNKTIYKINFPERMTDGKDVTDYFVKFNGSKDELINELSEYVAGKEPIDVTKFKELTSADVAKTLGLTIKKDEDNKLVSFMCMLSAFTDSSQFNISFNAPSSTGKSYIPIEISKIFPDEDVIELGYCSPTSFFHDVGGYDKDKNIYIINLSRKIIVFLDQPHNQLLERLRPILSHDKKEIQFKTTDKSQKSGLRTKNVLVKGYPSVIFCSAGLRIDEQEGTRFILLSPETSQGKIKDAILEKIKKDSDNKSYKQWLDSDPSRALLKERIEAIRNENIGDIKIIHTDLIEKQFFNGKKVLKPRHQRDIGRLISLVKGFALLNVWFREREGNDIIANKIDIKEACSLWDKISECQEHNLPPFVYDIYKEVIVSAFEEKNKSNSKDRLLGLTRNEIKSKYYKENGRAIDDWRLRQQIIPMLVASGLICEEQDPNDKRKMLISTSVEVINRVRNNIVSQAGGYTKE